MVKLGDHIRSITTDQISLFFADGRDVYLVTNQLRKFIIDYTLESLEEILDQQMFHRLNRSYIINIDKISNIRENGLFISGKEIPISKAHKQDVLKRLNII